MHMYIWKYVYYTYANYVGTTWCFVQQGDSHNVVVSACMGARDRYEWRVKGSHNATIDLHVAVSDHYT